MDDYKNRLGDDYLPQPDPDAFGPRTKWHDMEDVINSGFEGFDKYVMHPGNRLMWMPLQALTRYMDPTGADPFWRSGKVANGKDMQIAGTAAEQVANKLMRSGYQPGPRESDNATIDYRLKLF